MKYALQTAVGAVIDIACHISAKKYHHAPAEARDALKVLTEGGLISNRDLLVYGSMIGFRNRVVHGYQEISSGRVFDICRNELGDFERFIRQVFITLPAGK